MTKKIIHIGRQTIASNRKHGTNLPPVIVRSGGKSRRCQEAVIFDDQGNEVARIVHSPHKPLSCGARIWIETSATVELVQECRDYDTSEELNG